MAGIEGMASSMPGKPSTFELHLQFTAAHLEVPLLPRAIWDAEEGSWGSAVGYTVSLNVTLHQIAGL